MKTPGKYTDNIIVSIVILSLLRKSFTQRCIESILRFTKIPFEVIIVDMGADQNTASWLRDEFSLYQNITLIFNTENVGTTKGRNQGARKAKGKYLLFLDNDMRVGEGWLEPLIQQLENNPESGACGSLILSESGSVLVSPVSVKAHFSNGNFQRIGLELFKTPNVDDIEVQLPTKVPWYPLGCFLIRKSLFDRIEGLDENLFLCEEDKDLCLSINKTGFEIHYVPGSRVWHGSFKNAENTPDYKSHRLNLKKLFADKRYFENKWNCKTYINTSWSYLKKIGLTDAEIDKKRRFDFTTNVIDDR